MIHHWKTLDSEITDFEYHHDPSASCEIIRGYYFCKRVRKAKFEEFRYNISEKQCELKAIEPVRERSERASVDIVG